MEWHPVPGRHILPRPGAGHASVLVDPAIAAASDAGARTAVPVQPAGCDRAPAGAHARGRRRSPRADAAIVAATLRLLGESGYDALSMEGVAAAAGVAKSTLYRRYPGKAELVVATIGALPELQRITDVVPDRVPERTRDALRELLRGGAAIMATPGAIEAMGALYGGDIDAELASAVRGRIVGPQVGLVSRRIDDGIGRGEVRPDAPVEAAVDAAWGALLARSSRGLPIDDAWLEDLLTVICDGIASR